MKFQTIKKCMQCKFCELGRRKPVMPGDQFKIIIMCGATGKYILLTSEMLDCAELPEWCPLPDTDKDDGVCAVMPPTRTA